MVSDWLKTQKKPTRTNQIRDVLTTKIQENGHGFQHLRSNRKAYRLTSEADVEGLVCL